MSEKIEMSYYTEKCVLRKKKDCDVLSRFMYGGYNFTVVEAPDKFNVCVQQNGGYFSVWNCDKTDDIYDVTESEVKSNFRKGYTNNGITKEMVETFINNPSKYKSEYIKKKE